MRRPKQTRVALSMRAETYESVRQHCEERGITPTSFIEAAVVVALNAANAQIVTRDEALRRRAARAQPHATPDVDGRVASTIFSF